jgi:cellulose synthase/poly-beta-1,6-N-acetylglucosamine synthase-like glycosyltransferase
MGAEGEIPHSHIRRDEHEALDRLITDAVADEYRSGSRERVLERVRRLSGKPRDQHARTVDRLRRLDVHEHRISAAIDRVRQNGTPLVHELACSGHLDLRDYYRLLAKDLDLNFALEVDHKRMVVDATSTRFKPGQTVQICCRDRHGDLVLFMAPDARREDILADMLRVKPEMRSKFQICPPTTILDAIEANIASKNVENAVNQLHNKWPELSAKETLIPSQAFVLGMFVVLLPLALVFAFWKTLLAIHIVASVFFAAAIYLRIAAWWQFRAPKPIQDRDESPPACPVYSVLVALHKEGAVAAQLVRAMSRLDWPSSRLEVFYVCEADDPETLTALNAIQLPPSHRVILVPVAEPRTKPKALNYALERTTGDLIVIYDAEDRPHRSQLKEAWARFRMEPEDLACLQSPLDIANAGQSWFSAMFAFEYATHFRGLLPYLAKIGAPLPLGGTSNHFRRSALLHVLAWDPFNVTEDADLGIRFCRFGYRCGVLSLPTLEDAPTSLSQWVPQRTRWIKGWMQTFLVHNRKITNFRKTIGNKNFSVLQILMTGFIMSPLLYALTLIQIFSFIIFYQNKLIYMGIMIKVDITLFLFGHLIYLFLAFKCWRPTKSGYSAFAIAISLPVYWTLATYAAWRALWKLIRAPHQWEKTPHKVAYKAAPTESQRKMQ